MMPAPMFHVDEQWTRLGDERDYDNNPTKPQWVKNVRGPGGMIRGRVLQAQSRYDAQKFEFGHWKSLGLFDDADKAALAITGGLDR